MKIYTYSNPFKIDEYEYWNEIKKYPHLCVSQTLVQGMNLYYGRDKFSIICTLEDYINDLYADWANNPTLRIEQYLKLSREINLIENKKIKDVLNRNKREVLNSVRYLIELGCSALDITKIKKTNELIKEYITIFNNLIKSDEEDIIWINKLNGLLNRPKEALKESFTRILKKEIINIIQDELKFELKDEKINFNEFSLDQLKKYITDNNVQNTILEHCLNQSNIIEKTFDNNSQESKCVIHGVHRFTPMILNLISHMQKKGIEIIFLIPYCENYSQIYQTWRRVYSWVGVDFENIDTLEYTDSYHSVAKAIANFAEGRFEEIKKIKENNVLINFDNMTSFSNYVAKIYEDAKKDAEEKNRKNALAFMEEQFYAPEATTINNILRSYFPEQFGEKHFLSYPIGQFILSLYNMWDKDNKRMIYDEDKFIESISLNIWGKYNKTPIQIYRNIRLFLKRCKTIDECVNRLNLLKANLDNIKCNDGLYEYFKRYSFYNVSKDDITYFIGILEDLSKISKTLFNSGENEFNIIEHFQKLINIINEKLKTDSEISEYEMELISELNNKLIGVENDKLVGNIDDIKELMHFYLNAKLNDNSANWIVRNFEQIDGAVLMSGKFKYKNKKISRSAIYHFALLSDKNMKKSISDFLPWPLNEDIFDSINSLYKEIIKCCYKEYRNFLRYSLFYGILFSKKTIKFSYVSTDINDEDVKQLPYFLFNVIGIKEERDNGELYGALNRENKNVNLNKEVRGQLNKLDEEMFSICPNRFLLNNLIDKKVIYYNEFHCIYYTMEIARQIAYRLFNKYNDVDKSINKTINILKDFLPFYNEVEISDIKFKLYRKLNEDIKSSYNKDDYYRKIREFLVVKITDNGQEIINMSSFSSKKKDDIIDWLKSNRLYTNIDTSICGYCNQKDNCLEYYLKGE